MTDETMRAEFEAAETREGGIWPGKFERDRHGHYTSIDTGRLWTGWRMAIATERARCAEIARSMGENEGPDYRRACDDIAERIEGE